MKLYSRLQRLPSRTLLILASLSFVAIGVLDAATGTEISFSTFYLVPIILLSTAVSRRISFLGCFLAAAVSFMADWYLYPRYSSSWIHLWNAAMRFGTFCLAGQLTVEITTLLSNLRQEVLERRKVEEKLSALNANLEALVDERTNLAEQRASQLRDSEAALRHYAHVLESVLASIGDAIVVTDNQGAIRLWNMEAARLWGFPVPKPGNLLSHSSAPCTLSVSDPQCAEAMRAALAGRSVSERELRLSSIPPGDAAWVRASARPMVDEAGLAVGAVLVCGDISSRKLLERQVAEISEYEQRRLGQDLHDGVCQHFVGVAIASNMLAQSLSTAHARESRKAAEIADLIREGILQARELAHALCPVELEREGLVAVLEELTLSVERRTGRSCRFIARNSPTPPSQQTALTLYRIAQEAVSNAIRHGHAPTISVELSWADGSVKLTVSDTGSGFLPDPARDRGMGLVTMRTRARSIGASLEIRSKPGAGTVVTCVAPPE